MGWLMGMRWEGDRDRDGWRGVRIGTGAAALEVGHVLVECAL